MGMLIEWCGKGDRVGLLRSILHDCDACDIGLDRLKGLAIARKGNLGPLLQIRRSFYRNVKVDLVGIAPKMKLNLLSMQRNVWLQAAGRISGKSSESVFHQVGAAVSIRVGQWI